MTTGQALERVEHGLSAAAPVGAIDMKELRRRAETLARSPLVPDALRNKSDAIMQIGMWGAEHGVPLTTAIQSVYVVKGRPFPSSQLGLALVHRAGHQVRFVESSSEKAVIKGRRLEDVDDPDAWTTVTWTWQDAERAQLATKDVWKQYPQAMLRARAASDLVKMAFPDVLAALGVNELAPDNVAEWEPEAGGAAIPESAAPVDDDEVVDAELVCEVAGCDTEGDHTHDPDIAQGRGRPKPPPDDDVREAFATEDPAPQPEKGGSRLPLAAQIAVQCDKAGVDRKDLILAISGGEKSSAKDIEPDEAEFLFEMLAAVRDGKLRIEPGDPPRLVDVAQGELPVDEPVASPAEAQPAPAADPGGEEDSWTADQWRAFLAERGVKVSELLREANRLAREDGDPPPPSLDDLKGRTALCSLLRGFVEDQTEQRRAAR